MHGSSDRDGAPAVMAMVIVFILLAGAGGFFYWQRHQVRLQQALASAQEPQIRAVAEAEEARARAVAEEALAQAVQANAEPLKPSNGVGNNPDSIDASIHKILQTQQRAWNAGDIDQFMEPYWKSGDLTFSSGGKLTRSWQATLENYNRKYPLRSDMGTLTFQNLEVTSLGPDAAFVLGDWQIGRESEELRGNFTLVFRRLSDKWVIVHDHTSRFSDQ